MMDQLLNRYDQECSQCQDRLYWELKAWILGATHYSFADRRQYIDLQVITYKMKEMESRTQKCECDCPICRKCDEKDVE